MLRCSAQYFKLSRQRGVKAKITFLSLLKVGFLVKHFILDVFDSALYLAKFTSKRIKKVRT